MVFDIIAYIGGFFIAVSFVPQVLKSYRTKKVGDLSFGMLLCSITGTVLWLIYGLVNGILPIIAMNAVFGLIVGLQIYLKLTYGRSQSKST